MSSTMVPDVPFGPSVFCMKYEFIKGRGCPPAIAACVVVGLGVVTCESLFL